MARPLSDIVNRGRVTPPPMRASIMGERLAAQMGASLEVERAYDEQRVAEDRRIERLEIEARKQEEVRREQRRARLDEMRGLAQSTRNDAMANYGRATGRPMAKDAAGNVIPELGDNDWNATLAKQEDDALANLQKEQEAARKAERDARVAAAKREVDRIDHATKAPDLAGLTDTKRKELEDAAATQRTTALSGLMPEVEARTAARFADDDAAREAALDAARMGQIDSEVIAGLERDMPQAFASERAFRDQLAADDAIRARRKELEQKRYEAEGKVLEIADEDPRGIPARAPRDFLEKNLLEQERLKRQSDLASRAEAIRTRDADLLSTFETETRAAQDRYNQAVTAGRLTQPQILALGAERDAGMIAARERYDRGRIGMTPERAKLRLEVANFNEWNESISRPTTPTEKPRDTSVPVGSSPSGVKPIGTAPAQPQTAAPIGTAPAQPQTAAPIGTTTAPAMPSTNGAMGPAAPLPVIERNGMREVEVGATRGRAAKDVLADADKTARETGAEVYLRPDFSATEADPEMPRPSRFTPDEVDGLKIRATKSLEGTAKQLEEIGSNLASQVSAGAMDEATAQTAFDSQQSEVIKKASDDVAAVQREAIDAVFTGRMSVGQARSVLGAIGLAPNAVDDMISTTLDRSAKIEDGQKRLEAVYAANAAPQRDLMTTVERQRQKNIARVTGQEGWAGFGRFVADIIPQLRVLNIARDTTGILGGDRQNFQAGQAANRRADIQTAIDETLTRNEQQAAAILAEFPDIDEGAATQMKLQAARRALGQSAIGLEETLAKYAEEPMKMMPFVGDLVGAAIEMAPVINAAQKARRGEELNETDEFFVENYLEQAGRDHSYLGLATEIVAQLPAFGVEIFATGGLGTAGKKLGAKAITGIVGKEVVEGLEQWAAKRAVTRGAASLGASLVGTTAQTPFAMADKIAADIWTKTQIPDLTKYDGDTQAWIAGPGQGFGRAVLGSGFDAWVEMVSETSGGLLRLPSALTNKLAKSSWVKAARKLNPAYSTSIVGKIARRTQLHGPLGEIFEERVGDVMRGVGYEVSGGKIGEDFFVGLNPADWKWPTAEQWAGEALGMLAGNAGFAAINARATAAGKAANRRLFQQNYAPVAAFGDWSNPDQVANALNDLTGRDASRMPYTAADVEAIEAQIGPLAELPSVRRAAKIDARFGAMMDQADALDDLDTLGRATSARVAHTRNQTQQAVVTIEAHRAAAGMAAGLEQNGLPAEAAIVSGAQKLAAGRPIAELTAAERSVWMPMPQTLPDGQMVPAPVFVEEVNGRPIVTTAGMSQLSQIVGQDLAEALLPMPESKARRLALQPDRKPWTPPARPSRPTNGSSSASSAPSSSSPAAPAPSSTTVSPAATVGTRTTWRARGEAGTVVEIPADAANSLEEAERQLAEALPFGEMLAPDSMEPPSVRQRRDQTPDADEIPGLSANPGATGSSLADAENPRPLDHVRRQVDGLNLPPAQRGKAGRLLDVIESFGAQDIFEAIEFTNAGQGMEVDPATMTLRVDLAKLGQQGRGTDHVVTALIEEIVHAAALRSLDAERVAELWRAAPGPLKKLVLQAYRYDPDATQEGLSDFQMGHELIRMVVQDRAFRARITEAQDIPPTWAQKLVDLLRDLVAALRKQIGKLDKPLRKELDAQVEAVIKTLEDFGVAVTRAEPGPETPPMTRPRGERGIAPVDPADAGAQRITAAGPTEPTATREPRLLGATGTAYTSNGEPIEYQWAVVEAGDLITSHSDSLAANPEYDQALQGRNRDSAASEASVTDIEGNTTFARLSDSGDTSSGSPFVGPDLMVESGNGRSIALRRAYRKGRENVGTYKAELVANAERYGLEPAAVEGLVNPVLVRIRRTEVDRQAFAEDANRPTVARLSERETALQDAKALTPSVLEQLEVTADGDLYTPSNRSFFQQFFRMTVSTGELPGLINAEGIMTQAGLNRVRNAVFVSAYGENPRAMRIFERLVEEIDPDQRNVVNALVAAAPEMARYQAEVAGGSAYPTSFPDDLVTAASDFLQMRQDKTPLEDFLGQQEMFLVRPATQAALMRFFNANVRSARRLSIGVRNVLREIERAGNPQETDMFGAGSAAPVLEDILPGALEREALIGSEVQGEMALGMGSHRQSPKPDPRLIKVFGADSVPDVFAPPPISANLREGDALLISPVSESGEITKEFADIPASNKLVIGGFLSPGRHPRSVFHDAVVEYFTFGRPSQEKPIAVFSAGGGAAGKSTLLRAFREQGKIPQKNQSVDVNADDVKELIPEFNTIVALGDGRGASVTHEESSMLAKRVYRRALKNRQNIVYDATLANPGKAIPLLEEVKRNGYGTVVFGISVDPYEALVRATERAGKEGRWVPPSALLDAHQKFNATARRYSEFTDTYYLYESPRNGKPRLIFSQIDGKLVYDGGRRYEEKLARRSSIDSRAKSFRGLLSTRNIVVRRRGNLSRGVGRGEEQNGKGNQTSPIPGVLSPVGGLTFEDYLDAALSNLKKSSRTATGILDTTASAGKADQMAISDGAEAARLAVDNFTDTIRHLWENRARSFRSPSELMAFVDDVSRRINKGIVRDGELLRKTDSENLPYTRISDIPAARADFATRFFEMLETTDPVDLAAWVHWRLNFTDHFYADGVGKTSEAIADWVLMRSGAPLPVMPSERKDWFKRSFSGYPATPRFPESYNPGFATFLLYFREITQRPAESLAMGAPAFSAPQEAVEDARKKMFAIVADVEASNAIYDSLPDARGGKVIGTDIARELLPEYRADREGKIWWTKATAKPASAFIKRRLAAELKNRGSREVFLLTAGGVAAGKSTAVSDEVVDRADLVYDTTMRDPKRGIELIETALENGWRVEINYVQRPPGLAVDGAIFRAQSAGRWGPIWEIPETHVEAQKSIIEVSRHFEGDGRVAIKLWYNDSKVFPPPPPRLISLSEIEPGGALSYDRGDESQGVDQGGIGGTAESLPARVREESIERAREVFASAVASGKYEPRILSLVAQGDPAMEAIAGQSLAMGAPAFSAEQFDLFGYQAPDGGIRRIPRTKPAPVTAGDAQSALTFQGNLFDWIPNQETATLETDGNRLGTRRPGAAPGTRQGRRPQNDGEAGTAGLGDLFAWGGGPSAATTPAGGPGQSGFGGSGNAPGGLGGTGDATAGSNVGGGTGPDGGGSAQDRPVGDTGGGVPGDGADLTPRPAKRPAEEKPILDRPTVPSARNFVLPDGFEPSPGGAKARINANFDAIKLLRTLEDEGREATPEEKMVLVRYTGWGSFKEPFNTLMYEDAKRRLEEVVRSHGEDWETREYQENPSYYGYYGRINHRPDEAFEAKAWMDNHGALHERLKAELTPQEFDAAFMSIGNAHYTAAPIVDAVWEMARKAGFRGGRALEPSAGVGHFIGRTPADLADRTAWEAVELDEITAKILGKLYPESRVNSQRPDPTRIVQGQGFESARIPNNSLDLVISNVPFDAVGPGQSKAEFGIDFNLHNYFFARALAKAKPGGLVVFITTHNTMDSAFDQRQWLAEHGELVHAVRLPKTAFKKNAGTEVVTDIIVLRKPDGTGTAPVNKAWNLVADVGTTEVEQTVAQSEPRKDLTKKAIGEQMMKIPDGWIPTDPDLAKLWVPWSEKRTQSGILFDPLVSALYKRIESTNERDYWKRRQRVRISFRAKIRANQFFEANPEAVVGTHSLDGSMYRENEYTLLPPEGGEEAYMAAVRRAVDATPDVGQALENAAAPAIASDMGDREGAFVERDGKFFQVFKAELLPMDWKPTQEAVFRSWSRVLATAERLLRLEQNPATEDTNLEPVRAELNALFDAHVEAHGHPADPNNKTNNHRHLVGDSSGYALVQSLESPSKDVDARGKVTYTYEKAPIMQRRILRPVVEPETAADLSDAYKISMTYRGRVEVDFIASLLNLSPDEARAQLLDTGLVFEDPMTGLIVDSDEYLSGNVVAKYIAAEAAAKEDSRYQRNAAALADVRPELKQPAQIAFQIGQTWIPNEIYSLFAQEALGIPYADVRIDPLNRSFTGSGGSRDWGTSRVDAADLLRAVVLDKAIAVYDGSGENRVFNPEATEAALSKAEEIRREFGNWVKSTPLEIGGRVVGEIAAEEYNRVVNVLRPPMFRGEWVNLPDQSGEINLTDHRKAVIARFLTQGYGMMAHGVGSGKTYAQIALAHELKRLGKANKVVIVAMNPTVEQFAASYKKAYPQARLLVANPKGNFDKSRRAQFYSQMATGDFDAIIIPHSTLKQIPHSPAAIAAHYEMLLQELNAGLAAAIAAGNKKGANQIRTKIRKTRESMAKRMAKAAENRDDGAIEWESMGIDALIVDEAHAFKNAPVVTALKRVKNLPTGSASDNALSMMLKTADVQRRRRGKNVFFATGTPITNTIAEAFVMLRYLAPEAMRDLQIHSFDDFVRNFATTEENPEATWRGKVQMTTRLSKFVNGQSLINLIRSVFDVALGNEKLGLDVPRVKGGGPNQIVVEQTDPGQVINDWILDIVDSYEGIQWGNYSEQERKTLGAIPIVTMQAGLAAATDPRLIDPAAPDDPNSKVNRMVDEIWKIYQEGKAEKVTQAVFSDLRRPFKTKLLVDTGMISGLPFGSEAMGVDQSEEEEDQDEDEDKDDDSDNRFDLFEDIKAKLVARGMNPKEIWWPTSESAEKLADQFDKLNSGEIRLVLGGTAKIGTGVNFQERLGAVHHLNPPRDMKPAMMEQRNGRIIRQGNLHAEWAHNAFVEVVERAAGQKFEGKNPRKRRDAAQAWLEENGRPDVAEAAETAAARYDIQIFEYASENSIDSAIFSMMAAKQGFIAQALSETTSEDEFADPADEIKMAMAEIAARTMGDPDLIRMVELEREVRELRNRAQNYAGTIANKRGDIRSLRQNLRWIQENDAARAALPPSIETLFDDPKALPVWKFGNFTFDPYDKKKDATPMVGGIERWLSDLRPGNHSLTVGDLKIGVQKYDSLRRDEPASGEVEIRVGGIALAKRGFKGAKGLIQQTYGLVRDVAAGERTDRANQRRIERELPILEAEDLDAPFPEEDKLRVTEEAYAAVRQRVVALLAAKAEERAARRAERLGRNVEKDPGEDAIVAMVSNAAGVINAPKVARIWAEQQERARPVETLPGLAMGAPSQVTADQDREYLDAVERGDMARAQRMVDEAARAAGFTVNISSASNTNSTRFEPTSPKGLREEIGDAPLVYFHGSRASEKFSTFNTKYGSYFTSDESYADFYREVARDFGVENPTMYRVYIKAQSPEIFNGDVEADFERFTSEREESISLGKRGFDSQVMLFGDGDVEVRVNSPNQIKSADPVTYDESGTVIPLSQRFNPAEESILRMGAPTRPRLDLEEDWSTWPFAEVVMDIAGVPERVRRPMRKKPKLSVLQRHAGGPRALERALDNAGLAMGAWHGTPHKVDRFSVEKIGTGEGNQSYGWGLYFAEAKAVAEQYRDTLSNIRRYSGTIDGRPPRDRHEAEMAWEIEKEYGGDVEAYLAAIRDRNQQFLDAQNRYWGDRRPPEKAAAQERELRLDYLDKEHMARNLAGKKIDIAIGGRLYRVDIKADPETEFLDYNKPLAQQHPKIREAYLRALREVLKVNPTRLPAGFDPDRIAGGGYAAALGTIDDRDPEKSASMRMLAQGIKGIRYLGSGGRNFVVFDDSLVEILEENGKAVSAPVREEQLALAMGYRPADGPGRESDPQAWDDETAIRSTLDYFSRKLPSPAAMDERRRRVGEATSKAEPAGDLNLDGTPNRVDIRREIAAVRDAQLDNLRGQTHEQWMAEAKRLIARDYEGVVRELLEAAQEGRPLDNPAMVKAAQIIIPRVWREAKATGDRQGIRDAQALTYAYLEGGTRASYVLGARRDMFRTPAERHVDFLAGIIGRVPPEVRKRAEAAPTPAEKRRKIAELQDQLTRARETARGKSAEVEELEARIEKAKGAGAAGLAEIARLNQELANVKSVHNATAQRARETIDRLEAEQAANKAQIAKLEKQLVNVKRLHNASVDNAKGAIKRLGAALGEARKQKDRAEILGEAHEARLAKVEATLAEMGLSLHDIFSHQAVVRLRGSEIVARVIEENFSAPQRAAIRFSLPPEGHSPRDVAKRTGVARETIPGLMTKFRQKIEARFLELAKKGLTLSDFMTEEGGMFNVTDRIGEQGESLRFGTAPVTEEQAKAAAAEMMNALFGGHHTLEDRRGRRKPNQAPFDINNPVHVAQVGQTLKTAVDAGAFDMAYEYWINGILSGPQTHAVNIAGNAMNIAMEYGAQRWMEAIWNTLIGDPKGATFGEYGHIIRSIPGTWAKSFAAAVKAWNTEESFLSAELLNDPTKVGGAEKAGGLNNESRKAIPDRLGKLGTTGGKDLVTAVAGFVKGKGWSGVSVGRTVRIPGRALLFMDTLFKSVVARTEVAGQAYRRGRAQGIQGAALESFMKGEVNTPGSESWIAAVDKAEELTFTNDLKGAADGGGFFEQIVKKLQDSRHADTTLSPLAASAIGWFFPFIQTPFQIFKTGLRRTPFGAFGVLSHLLKTGVVTWRQGGPFLENYGKARLARDLTDQTIGLLITWILYGMVEGDDDDDTKNWLITGSRPYGVVNQGERELTDRLEGGAMTLRIGGRDGVRFDFSRLEPFATILGSITDSVRSIKRMENGAAKVDELAKFHQYALSQATDKTFLQGIVKIGELMEPGQTTGATAARTVLQAIVPNWVRQPLRLTDDYVRESKTAPWYYHAVPLGGFAEPKADLYGNPMRKGATPFAPVLGPLDRVARIGIDTGLEPGRVPHVADIAIRNWNREKPEKGDQYFPPGNTIRTFKDFAGRTQRLSAAQLAEVERIGGVRLRVMLAQSISLAEAQKPTEATIEKIRAARSKVFAAARDEVVARPSPTPRRGRPLAEGRNKTTTVQR